MFVVLSDSVTLLSLSLVYDCSFVGARFDPSVKLTCWCTPSFGEPLLWIRLLSGGHCTPHWASGHSPKYKKNLPAAGGTGIKEAVLSRRGPFIVLGSG